MKKRIPKFRNEDEERDFWSENDSSEYLNWKGAERVLFPNLKPSTRAISLPNLGTFDALIQMARQQAKEAGLKPKDIQAAITKVRGRKRRSAKINGKRLI